MNKKSNFAAGIVAGAVVGAISALLLAPQSGKKTRQDIVKHAQKVGKKVALEAEKVKDLTHDKYVDIVEKVAKEYKDKVPVGELKTMCSNLKKEWPKIAKTMSAPAKKKPKTTKAKTKKK